jgi:DNA-binding NarL/FixJ family response regulator
VTRPSIIDANAPTHVVGQFYSWSDGERCALGLVIEAEKQPKVVVFRWGFWPRQAALPPAQQERRARQELTPQQIAVMWHVVDGKSNTEISKELGLNHGTIKFHVKNAARKLGCNSWKEAAARFLSRGPQR